MNYDPNVIPYEMIGGEKTIRKLVKAFYARVRIHPDLAPIFPGDWDETERKQYMFLTQFLGGPPLYSQEFGHPMLRARHLPFPVTPKRAEAWLSCMQQAMNDIKLEGDIRQYIWERLVQTAHHMINSNDE
ncbi:globin [Effusibacillus consociatus]|uniref:Globin n=1 Tax=Effusibacillus consociatus TaxID=1117041 RepID=A0ABV9PZ76_9BACL